MAVLIERSTKKMELEDGTLVEGHVLRTAKKCGVYSQGLLLTLDSLALGAVAAGEDVAARLGIRKYERPETFAGGDVVGPFPSHLVQRSDAERAQNLTGAWDLLRSRRWIATEKVDGTSLTVVRSPDGELRVCQRNLAVAPGSGLYGTVAERFGLAELVGPGEAIQAEIYGPGVQGNALKVPGARPRLAVFAFHRAGRPVLRPAWPVGVLALPQAPVYEELSGDLPATVDAALAAVDGICSLLNPHVLAEGVVFHEETGHRFAVLDGRACFKVVSNRWLLKHET